LLFIFPYVIKIGIFYSMYSRWFENVCFLFWTVDNATIYSIGIKMYNILILLVKSVVSKLITNLQLSKSYNRVFGVTN